MHTSRKSLEEFLESVKDHDIMRALTFMEDGNRVLEISNYALYSNRENIVFIVKGNELIPAQIIDGKVSMVIR